MKRPCNRGSIPYGEHQPYPGDHSLPGQSRMYYDHCSNGKDGLSAVMFACMGNKPVQTEYFSRMSVAAIRGEVYGHTGQGFSYLWTSLGANMGGATAVAEYQKQLRWDRDMKRRCDGSFVYEGDEQWGPGKSADYYDNSHTYWGNPTAYYLLHAAIPLKNLYITGKNADPANPKIVATPANTPVAITLPGFSCRSNPVACSVVAQPAHGTLTGTPPNLVYTPAPGYQDLDQFTFKVTDSLTDSAPATVDIVVGSGGTGLTGFYYDNLDFTSLKATQTDPFVNFDWGTVPPNTLGAGTYSVRWTGQVLAPESGAYRFSARTSDGVRLWINGVQVINDWNNQVANIWNDSAPITFTAGQKYNLKLEYYDNANPSTVRLYWYIPSRQAAMIVPQELLFPVAGVSLTSPPNGTRFGLVAGQPTAVTLTADASDVAGTVASVAFYNGTTLLGTDTTFMLLKITVDADASAANLVQYPYYQIGKNETLGSMMFDVAEIIGYSSALSAGDEALVGGYLAAKYGLATAYPATGSLANQPATGVTTTTATLNASLMCNGNTYDVVAYWGPVNGGMNPANWANSAAIGSWNNVASIDISRTLTNLAPGATCHFTFRASNASHTLWPATPLSFTTITTAMSPSYASWVKVPAQGFTPGFNDGPADDPDHDGMTNRQEFAFGLKPMKGTSCNPITRQLDPATGRFQYTRRGVSGLTYQVLTSTDLGIWEPDAGATEEAVTTNGDIQTVTVHVSTAPANGRLFVRVQAQ